jgi:hypothetical protein
MDTAKFTGDVGKTAQQMARLTAEAGKIGAALGASIGVGLKVIGGLVKESIDAADATAKMAQSLGTTTESLSQLTYAADLSGVSQETLATSMGKLARQAADAAAGNKAAGEVFAAMGLQVTDANGALKSTDQLLADVADKFASYEDGAAKTALAQELFGKSGAQLIPLLNAGASGIQDLKDEADRLGITLSGPAGKAAEQFNDNIARLNYAKQGLGRQIAQQLLPTLSSLTTQLFASAKETDAFARAATVAATGVKLLLSAGTLVVGVFKTLGEYLGGIGAQAVAFFSGNFREAFEIGKMTNAGFAENLRGTMATLGTIWAEGGAKIEGEAPATAARIAAPLVGAAANAKKASDAIQTELDRARKAFDAFTQAEMGRIKGANDQRLQFLQQITGRAAAIQEDLQREVIDNAFFDGDITMAEFERAQKMLYGLRSVAGEAKQEVNEFGKELGLTFTSAFEDAIIDGRKFRDVLKSIGDDMLRILLRRNVTQPLANALGGIDFASFFMPSGGGKVAGGGVSPGMGYMVGEQGPEPFIPNSAGTIMSNAMMRQQQTSAPVQVSIEVVNNTGTAAQPRVEQTGTGSFRVILDAVRTQLGAEIANGQGLMVPIAARLGANSGAALRRRTNG